MKNPVDLCVRWALMITVILIARNHFFYELWNVAGPVWSLLSLPWDTRTAWTSPPSLRERGWEAKCEKTFVLTWSQQVERGGELFRASCDICCESVPLLRQPGRSLTCEVRTSFNGQPITISCQLTTFENSWKRTNNKTMNGNISKNKFMNRTFQIKKTWKKLKTWKILDNSLESSGEVGQRWEISEKQNRVVWTQHTPTESITKYKVIFKDFKFY